MSILQPEGICGGCNPTYSACALNYPMLYYACGNTLLIHNLRTHQTEHSLLGHKSQINCVTLTSSEILSGSTDKSVIVWRDNTVFKVLPHSSSVIFLTNSEDFSASISTDGCLSIFTPNFEVFQELKFNKNLQETCAFVKLNSGIFLATAGVDSKIHVYWLDNKEFVYQNSLESHLRNIRGLAFQRNHDSALLASGGQDCLIRIWKFSPSLQVNPIFGQGVYTIGPISCQLDAVLSGHSGLVSSVQWENSCLISCSHDFSVIIWEEDLSSKTWQAKVTLGQLGGNKNVFLQALGDQDRVMAYTYSGGFYCWNKNEDGTWAGGLAPTGHKLSVTGLAVTEDFVVTCSLDQTCRLWTYPGYWVESSRPMVHGYDMNGIVCTESYLISAADEKILRVFEPSTSTSEILFSQGLHLVGNLRGSSQVLGLTTKTVQEADFDFKNLVITEDILNSYTLWPETNKLYGHGYEITAIALDCTGRLLASACKSITKEHSTVFLWDLDKKCKTQSLEFHNLGVTDLAFSPDGQWLVTVSRDRSWCLYQKNGENQEFVKKNSKEAHGRVIYTCCWNFDSSLFVTGSRDKKLRIWNLNGEEVECFTFKVGVTAAGFWDTDGLAVGLESGEIQALKNGNVVGKGYHGESVEKIRVWKDRLFSVGADHTLRVFRIIK